MKTRAASSALAEAISRFRFQWQLTLKEDQLKSYLADRKAFLKAEEKELNALPSNYANTYNDQKIQELVDKKRDDYLRLFKIEDHIHSIPGIGHKSLSVLEEAGVHTAWGVHHNIRYIGSITRFGEGTLQSLWNWKNSILGSFGKEAARLNVIKEIQRELETEKHNLEAAIVDARIEIGTIKDNLARLQSVNYDTFTHQKVQLIEAMADMNTSMNFKGIAISIFLIPGRVITWWHYMFPDKGFSAVAGSRRRYRSKEIQILFSLVFWGIVIFLLIPTQNNQHNQPNFSSLSDRAEYNDNVQSNNVKNVANNGSNSDAVPDSKPTNLNNFTQQKLPFLDLSDLQYVQSSLASAFRLGNNAKFVFWYNQQNLHEGKVSLVAGTENGTECRQFNVSLTDENPAYHDGSNATVVYCRDGTLK